MASGMQQPWSALPDIDLQSMVDGPMQFWDNIARLQRMQVEFLVSLELGFARLHKEAWDQWICRYAGGVPIDV